MTTDNSYGQIKVIKIKDKAKINVSLFLSSSLVLLKLYEQAEEIMKAINSETKK